MRSDHSAYLFDLDGTLVDTAPDLQRALNHALASEGLAPVDLELTRHWVGHGVGAMLRAAIADQSAGTPGTDAAATRADGAATARLERLEEICVGYYAEHIADHSQPYPGVAETLQALAARAPLAVVTNKLAGLSERLLEALALARFFQVVVGRDTAAAPKPNAAPAIFACERMGRAVDRALFVGDSETDVGCARAAGCRIFVYRHGYNHGIDPDAMGADRVIESFRELI